MVVAISGLGLALWPVMIFGETSLESEEDR